MCTSESYLNPKFPMIIQWRCDVMNFCDDLQTLTSPIYVAHTSCYLNQANDYEARCTLFPSWSISPIWFPSSSFTASHSKLQLFRHSRQMNHQITTPYVSRTAKYPSGHVNRAAPNFTLRCDCTVAGRDTVTICSHALWVWRRKVSWRNFPILIVPLLSLRNRLKIEVCQVLSVLSWVPRAGRRAKWDTQGPPSSKAAHTLNFTSNKIETIYNDLAKRKAFSALCKIKLKVYERHGKYSKHEKGEGKVIK